jgi:hypothetical protein
MAVRKARRVLGVQRTMRPGQRAFRFLSSCTRKQGESGEDIHEAECQPDDRLGFAVGLHGEKPIHWINHARAV